MPGVHVTPLFLDTNKGVWVLHARFDPNTRLPRHYHSGTVHFYTTAGTWGYAEHPEDLQMAGSYLYEPAGSIHTFETKEGTEGFMIGEGANVPPTHPSHPASRFVTIGRNVPRVEAGWRGE